MQCASDRLSNGERLLKPLVDFLRSLTSNDLQGVRYHSHCRKKVVHVHKVKATNNRKSIDDSDGPSSAKRGRPSKADASKNPIRLTRNTAHEPKEKICLFSCIWEGEDLHRVESEPRGRKLIDIKNYTTDDKVRTWHWQMPVPKKYGIIKIVSFMDMFKNKCTVCCVLTSL